MTTEWKQSLDELRDAIAVDTARVDAVARLERPGPRAEYQAELGTATAELSGAGTTATLSDMVALETVHQQLTSVAAAVRSLSVRAAADRGMSRSFAETTRQVATKVEIAERAALVELDRIRPHARAAGVDNPDAARAAYQARPMSNLAIEALVGACASVTGDVAKEALLNLTTGVAGDTAEAIATAQTDRREMHTLQAMETTFGLATTTAEPTLNSATVLNQTVPSATRAVRYRLDGLLDADKASTTTVSGLSYNLVQRLRTVWETDVPTAELGTLTEPACGEGVTRTIDWGHSYQTMRAAAWDTADPSLSCVLRAGPRPRVGALGQLLESAVFRPARPGEPPRIFQDPAQLLETYGAAAVDTEEELVASMMRDLRREFGEAAAATEPKTHDSFMEALLGEEEPSYMTEAVGRSMRQYAEELAAGQTSPHVSTRTAARERLLTGQVQASATVRAVRTKLRHAASRISIARALRNTTAVQLGNQIYTAAFAAKSRDDHRVDKLAAVGPQPSLKLYLLRHEAVGQS